ncbi:MAG TPA: hypothetical protein VNY05_28415 [Candidatus Acidoferrales bacterium]|nr:hypothetical protein [Candidatus Acidoferrales bacterium]
MELRARVHHLAGRREVAPTVARDAVVDVPLAKAFQRIVRRQDALIPELDVAAVRFHEPASRMAAEHPALARLAGWHLDRRSPGVAVIAGMTDVGDVDGVRAGPALFDGCHVAAAWASVEGVSHDGDSG